MSCGGSEGQSMAREQAVASTHHVANIHLFRSTALIRVKRCTPSDELARGEDVLGIGEGDMNESVKEGIQRVEEG